MTPAEQKRTSKFLSLVLRHRPELARVKLDAAGWVNINDLLSGAKAAGHSITKDQLDLVVATNDKKRFSVSSDGTRIRAAQGHSVPIELGLVEQTPPDLLYHGTARKSLASILGQGLLPGKRHHVHLSPDVPTAIAVGTRHGDPVVFKIDTVAMINEGHVFFQADNGVWLTQTVPISAMCLLDAT